MRRLRGDYVAVVAVKGASSWLTLVRGLGGSFEVRKIGDLGKEEIRLVMTEFCFV